MFAQLTMPTTRRHAHSAIARPLETRLATYQELERAIGGLTAEHFSGADVALLSVACADDRAYAVIECAAEPTDGPMRFERAARAVAAGLSTTMLSVKPDAELRVTFTEGAGF